jgi:hypothetical protein
MTAAARRTTRVQRWWRCPCCGGGQHRYLSRPDDAPVCRLCQADMIRGHGAEPRVRRCVHLREADAQTAAVIRVKARLWTTPRTASQRALALTPEVRAAWTAVRRAKTRPALQRRGQRFIEVLLATTRDLDMSADGGWQTHIDSSGRVGRMRAVCDSMPALRFEALAASHGIYRRALFRGVHEIVLDPQRPEPGRPLLDSLRDTLVHEVLHLLDAEAMVGGDSHDRYEDRPYWDRRLARMLAMFPPSAYGTRSAPPSGPKPRRKMHGTLDGRR